MRVDIITIFPAYFAPLGMSLIGKAAARGDIQFAVHDLRAWSRDPHRAVDDAPYGGGPGMVMTPGPWGEALDAVAAGGTGPVPRLVVPAPNGVLFTQATAARYATEPRLIFACGRYEGIDARVAEEASTRMPVDEVSIGDYVLAGGEAAVLVMVEAICRLLPGVLGNAQSVADDSFGGRGAAPPQSAADAGMASPSAGGESATAPPAPGAAAPAAPAAGGAGGAGCAPGGAGGMSGLLEGRVYTRPRSWRGRAVPDVLVSGNHADIARWRRDEALRRTAATRPELILRIDPAILDARDRRVLSEAGFPVHAEDVAH
jgi:tRNA (guanine37-N1)-methyltransferase